MGSEMCIRDRTRLAREFWYGIWKEYLLFSFWNTDCFTGQYQLMMSMGWRRNVLIFVIVILSMILKHEAYVSTFYHQTNIYNFDCRFFLRLDNFFLLSRNLENFLFTRKYKNRFIKLFSFNRFFKKVSYLSYLPEKKFIFYIVKPI